MYIVRATILYLSILLAFLVGSAAADSRFYYVDVNGDGYVYVDIAHAHMGGTDFGYLDNSNAFIPITVLDDVKYNHGDIFNYAVKKTMGSTVTVVALSSYDNLVTYSGLISPAVGDIYQTAKIDWNISGVSGIGGKTTFTMDGTLSSSDGMRPVPIPGSALLLGSGVLCLVVIGRRRRTKKDSA